MGYIVPDVWKTFCVANTRLGGIWRMEGARVNPRNSVWIAERDAQANDVWPTLLQPNMDDWAFLLDRKDGG